MPTTVDRSTAVLAWVVLTVLLTPWRATAQLAPVVGTHYAGPARRILDFRAW